VDITHAAKDILARNWSRDWLTPRRECLRRDVSEHRQSVIETQRQRFKRSARAVPNCQRIGRLTRLIGRDTPTAPTSGFYKLLVKRLSSMISVFKASLSVTFSKLNWVVRWDCRRVRRNSSSPSASSPTLNAVMSLFTTAKSSPFKKSKTTLTDGWF